MYLNYNYVYVYVYLPIIVVCVKVFGQINSHRARPVRYPTKLINSQTYHQPNYNFDAYNPYVRPNQVFAETPPLRSSPYLVHDHNHNLIDDQYYNLRDTQAFQRRKKPYFGVNHVKTTQHLPKQRNVQHFNYNAGHRPQNKPSKEQYHKKREEIHHFHTHSAIIDEGGPHSVQKKKNTDKTNPDIFYFKAHLKNNKNPPKPEHKNQSKNQLLQNGPMDKYKDISQVYNAYNNQRAAKTQQNVKPNYNQNGHWNKDLYISKSDVHQNNQRLEKQSIRDQNKQSLNGNKGTNGKYNHQKSIGYQYKKDGKLPTSINDMLNQIPRKHSHNANTHPSPGVEYNQNIGNKNKKNTGIESHPNSDLRNKLKHNAKQKQKFSHQSISVRPLIFKQNQQEFPLEKSDVTKKKKASNNVSKKRPSKQQKPTTSEQIKRSKEPYKKTVALIREFTAIMPSDDDDDFSSLSLIEDTPRPQLTTVPSAKKTNKKDKQTKTQREDFYDDYEAPPKLDTDDEDVVKPVAETDEEEDSTSKTKQNTQHSDHGEYQKKSEELRRLMQEDLSNKLYDDDEEEELSKPANKENVENERKTVKNKNNNKKANNFEKEVDISADDLERYFDKEFSSFHSDKVDNSDIKPEVEEIEVSVQPLKPEQTEEVYDEEGDDNQFKGKNFKSEYESEPSEQKPKNKKSVEVTQKSDHMENESEPEYKTSNDFLRSHDDFLNRIDKENDKFRKDTEEKVRNSGKDEKDEEDSDPNGEKNAKNENEDENEEEGEKKEEKEEEEEEEAEPTEEENKNNKENNEDSEDSSSNNDDSKEKAKNETEEEETEDTKEDTADKDNDNEENNNDKTEEKVEKNEENERNEPNDQKGDNNAIKQNDEINEEYNVNEDNINNNNEGKCLDGSKCMVDNGDNAPKQLNTNEFEMKANDNGNINNNNEIENMIPIPISVLNAETEPPVNRNHQSYQTSLNPIPMPISMPYSDNEMLHQSKHLDDSHRSPELAMNPLPYYVDLQRINYNNGNILNAQKHNFVSDINNQRVIYDNMQK